LPICIASSFTQKCRDDPGESLGAVSTRWCNGLD
jgi:hypothetical protein